MQHIWIVYSVIAGKCEKEISAPVAYVQVFSGHLYWFFHASFYAHSFLRFIDIHCKSYPQYIVLAPHIRYKP